MIATQVLSPSSLLILSHQANKTCPDPVSPVDIWHFFLAYNVPDIALAHYLTQVPTTHCLITFSFRVLRDFFLSLVFILFLFTKKKKNQLMYAKSLIETILSIHCFIFSVLFILCNNLIK